MRSVLKRGEAVKYLRSFLILFPFCLCAVHAGELKKSTTSIEYRTHGSGDWNADSTWEYHNSDGWWTTSTPPSTGDSITILPGHTITVSSDLSICNTNIQGEVIVDIGKTLTVFSAGGNPDVTVSSTGVLRIKGALTVSGTLTLRGGSTVIYNGSTAQAVRELDYANLQIDNPAGVDLPIIDTEHMPSHAIRKGLGPSLAVASNVTVNGLLTLTNGDIRTGNNAMTLGASARISETASYSVLGRLSTTRQCTTGSNNTFGGMGLEINVGSGLPFVSVTRTTGSALSDTGKILIRRNFDLSTVAGGLNATLVFHYGTGELNGIGESNLLLYESTNGGSSWVGRGGTVNTGAHTITITGVNTLHSWTAGQPAGLPTLTDISPSSSELGTTLNITIAGTQFMSGSTSVGFGGSGITVNSTTVNSSTQITLNITVASGTSTGFRDVSVTTVSGTATLSNAFEVRLPPNPTPTLFSATPSTGNRGQSLAITLQGKGFQSGLTSVSFGDAITVTSVSVTNSSSLTAQIAIGAGAVLGGRDVSVTNPAPGGGSITLNSAFSILSPTPTISAITPSTIIRGQSTSVTVAGSNFIGGTTSISLGTGITINSFAVNSSTQVVANITLGADASTGVRDVVVTNAPPGGGSATLGSGLTVTNPAPTLSTISPILAARGDVLDVDLTGTNFILGVTTASFGDGIAVNSLTVSSLTRTTANISVGVGSVLGPRNVSVTNPAPGGGTSTLTTVFTVGNPLPTLTGITPAAGKRGQTLNLTLTGTGLISGSTSVNLGANILVKSLVVNTATQMTANVAIGLDAAAGARGVSVTNVSPGGGIATLAGGLTVENPVPVLSSIAPVNGVRGTTLNVTLTGSNFINGLSHISFGPDIQVNSVSVSSATQIVAGITIDQGATTASRDVIVTHAAPGGGTATLSGAFSITNPAPSVASVAPVSAGRGSVLNVTLIGSQFISGVTTVSFGADISVSDLLVKSLTESQVSITISSSASVGPRSVTITNAAPGGGSASLPNGFSVTTSPATEVRADPGALPQQYVLQEAYPNPFNPSTRVGYGLPEDSRIRLDVHNMLGNVVAELAVGERAKGLYELQWHADNLPSGVYLIRMYAESLESTKRFIASRKVVLVK